MNPFDPEGAEIARLTAELDRERRDNEAYCQRDMEQEAEITDLKQQVARLEQERDRLKAAVEQAADNGCGRQLANGMAGCLVYWTGIPQKWCSACICREALNPAQPEPVNERGEETRR